MTFKFQNFMWVSVEYLIHFIMHREKCVQNVIVLLGISGLPKLILFWLLHEKLIWYEKKITIHDLIVLYNACNFFFSHHVEHLPHIALYSNSGLPRLSSACFSLSQTLRCMSLKSIRSAWPYQNSQSLLNYSAHNYISLALLQILHEIFSPIWRLLHSLNSLLHSSLGIIGTAPFAWLIF